MRQVSNSADSLVLLGEMVEMASGYADQVEESAAHDEPFMVRLAYDQLFYLRKRVAALDDKLKNLNGSLNSKIRSQARRQRWGNQESGALDEGIDLREFAEHTH
ncbi:MAG TPA: hypothetical protein VGJ06_19260 [Candidatus Acidoferrum sp.]|jgi:hypothetical protein